MLRIHLYATFYCSREALKIMSRQSGELSAGKIINMGSIMGTAAGAGAIDYCAAKAGILGFTRALAREVASRNIQVNALAPGFVDTPLLDDMHEAYPLVAAATPLGRLGQPDDIAWAAVYLASSEIGLGDRTDAVAERRMAHEPVKTRLPAPAPGKRFSDLLR